jgi:hypothetical protein
MRALIGIGLSVASAVNATCMPGASAARDAGAARAKSDPSAASRAKLEPVEFSRLCVEDGRLEPGALGQFGIRKGEIRAVAASTSGNAAELAFTYRGPTREVAHLGSGEVRQQIGLKLRAQNTCNVVYVMWYVAPGTGIHASVKANPGLRTHADCGDRGYIDLKTTWRRDVPPIRPGERHTLSARIEGNVLRVSADDAPVWEGALPDQAQAFDGLVGIRADNVEADAELFAEPGKPGDGAGPCP